jgi:hypothetical protein
VDVGYVTEAPVWKTSYRLELGDKPHLQGWAIIDNSTDHDWDNINLTLVSGQPISFIEDLYTPLYIPRPVVPPEVQANPYPQLSESNVMENAQTALAKAARPEGHAMLRLQTPGAVSLMARDAYAATDSRAPTDGNSRLTGRGSRDAYAATGSPAPAAPSLGLDGVTSASTTAQAGELFQYNIGAPVSSPRQQSAMIPIVVGDIQASTLDIYNAAVNPNNPSNAAEVTNTTGLHLKAGPVTVLDGASYAGDARMPDLQPNEKQYLTYGVDLGITAVQDQQAPVQKLATISIKHGVLNLTQRSRIVTHYTFKSKLDKDRTIMVENPIQQDWTLTDPAKPDEKTKDYYRFRLTVAAGQSKQFSVTQEHTDLQTIGLIDMDVNLLLQYQTNTAASASVQKSLADIAQRRQKITQIQAQLDGQKARIQAITTEQTRIRQNMAQLDQNSALYKRYVSELNDQEDSLTKLRADIDLLQTQLTQAQQDLTTAIDNLTVN